MRSIRLEGIVLLFFFLHVLATGVDAIPEQARDPVSLAVRSFWQPLVRPYIAVTAQWQRWNLFAPDPLREVATLYIDVQEREGWRELWMIAPGGWPANCSQEVVHEGPPPLALTRLRRTTSCGGWWRETGLLKVARALSEENPKYGRSRQEFLQRLCAKLALPGGSTLRLRARSSDLLAPTVFSEVVRAETVCFSSSA